MKQMTEKQAVELEVWIQQNPGSRPAWWWKDFAPEPCRQRLGGTGDPAHLHLAYKPRFDCGIPATWISDWDVRFYNGRSRDIHGRPNSPYHKGDFTAKAIDPTDPPRYESEAAFLRRHNLLMPSELKRLKRKDYDEPEIVEP